MVHLKKIIIVLAISCGLLGCDALIKENNANNQKENNYVQLAKKFERIYLQKFRTDSAYKASAKLSEKKLNNIAQKFHFDEKKIENYKKEILQIAKSYGIDKNEIIFDKYFFINPYTGEILDKDYFKMTFAYTKYLKEKLKSSFKKTDKINKRISALTKKYNRLMKKAETNREVQKLQDEYLKKLDKLNDTYR